MWNAMIVLGLLGLLSLVAWLTWSKWRIRPRAMQEFAGRYIADPAFRESFEEDMERQSRAIDAANNAPTPMSSEVSGLIEDLLSPDRLRNNVASIRLEKAGSSVEEALLSA